MATYDEEDDFEDDDEVAQHKKQEAKLLQQEERAKFTLTTVYHDLDDQDIISMSCQNNVLAILGKNNKLVINDLDSTSPDATFKHVLTYSCYKLFLDPTGKHTFVSSTTGELFYFNPTHNIKCARVSLSSSGASAASAAAAGIFSAVAGQQQHRDLPNAVFIVESIGWDSLNKSTTTTGDILIGSKVGGMIYRLRIDVDKANREIKPSVQPIGTLSRDVSSPIGSIEIARWLKGARSDVVLIAVFISTSRRLYQGIGKNLNDAAKKATEKLLFEQPDVTESNCRGGCAIFRPLESSKAPQSFAWAATTGVRHGCFETVETISSDDTSLATSYEISMGRNKAAGFDRAPIDVALSAFHMFLLYEDRLTVLNHPAGMNWKSKISAAAARVDSTVFGGSRSTNSSNVVNSAYSPSSPARGRDPSSNADLQSFDFNDRVRLEAFKNRKIKPLLGIVRDTKRRKIYIYNATNIWDVEIEKESGAVWRLFLERALDTTESNALRERYFIAAYGLTKKKPKQHQAVTFAMGKFFMEMERAAKAAEYFSQCSRFEDVMLLLLAHSDQKLLLHFAERRLKVLRESPQSATKQSQLAVLVVLTGQLRIENYTAITDPANAIRARGAPHVSASGGVVVPSSRVVKQAADELLSFWKETAANHAKLFDDQPFYTVITRLLSAQGCTAIMLELSEATERFRYTMDHYHNSGDYEAVAKVLTTHCTKANSRPDLWYDFAPKLILHRPVALFKGLYKFKDSEAYNPERLIPAFINYHVSLNEDHSDDHQIIDYLSQLFRKGNLKSRVLHNMLISMILTQVRKFRTQGKDDEILLAELADVLQSDMYTVEFALRKCIEADQRELCVVLYERLGLYEEAVLAALSPGKTNSIDNAKRFIKSNISGVRNDAAMRKRLWLHVANAVTKNAGTREALDVIKESEGALRLEDVLSSFSDEQQVIQDFKDEICHSLDEYAKGIEALKKGMEEATRLAEHLKDDEIALQHQFGYITASQRCDVCQKTLLRTATTRPFLIYPACRHAFHEDCVEQLYARISEGRRKLIAEELELEDMSLSTFRDAECPYCGEYMILSCSEPFPTGEK